MTPNITVQEVFARAIHLMDENASDGKVNWTDTKEYEVRTISILNALMQECYPYSDTYNRSEPGKRPVCPYVRDFKDIINMDAFIVGTVLPYGLACELIKSDDPVIGNFFLQRYQELLRKAGNFLPAEITPITDVMGVNSW